ncbi:MAG: Mg2+ and Co2+ transporter CorB [Clostridia bacterium]|nr:Mg2+ and Co2+ transporter CorB [Clostridia bacterium]
MKSTDPVPKTQRQHDEQTNEVAHHETDKRKKQDKKKHQKRNLWPLKAMLITLILSALVNLISTLVLDGAQLWLAILITLVIVLLGVIFDTIGTATTSCDIQPLLAMASRKVKGAKTAVKLAQKSDIVSNVCNDIIGDICGIVSGACAATITATALSGFTNPTLVITLTIAVYAAISTLTVVLKSFGKTLAVNKGTSIVFGVAKILSIFHKEG